MHSGEYTDQILTVRYTENDQTSVFKYYPGDSAATATYPGEADVGETRHEVTDVEAFASFCEVVTLVKCKRRVLGILRYVIRKQIRKGHTDFEIRSDIADVVMSYNEVMEAEEEAGRLSRRFQEITGKEFNLDEFYYALEGHHRDDVWGEIGRLKILVEKS